MRDILDAMCSWRASGHAFALATVVHTSSSAPRGPGSSMAVRKDGTVLGSVSGGCVEAAVIEVCQEVLEGGPPRRVTYGYSDGEAFGVGLTCGGTVDVFVRKMAPGHADDLASVEAAVTRGVPVAVVTVIEGTEAIGRSIVVLPDRVEGSLGVADLDAMAVRDARSMLRQGVSGCERYRLAGRRHRDEVTVFMEVLAPRPRMLVFGATDFAAALAHIGRFIGFHITVCDARQTFVTPARFPHADELVVEWPHRYLAAATVDECTAICALTHDPRFDVPLLVEALQTTASYVGVIGSRRAHHDRMRRLREKGLTELQLGRLRAPIGLDLGGRTPEETAVSIAAEIIQELRGGSGLPLSVSAGPIHASTSTKHAVLPVLP